MQSLIPLKAIEIAKENGYDLPNPYIHWAQIALDPLFFQALGKMLEGMKEKSYKDMQESHKLAPNSYGVGADWGEHYALEDAITKIQG